jgi:hypothetical protein
VACTRLEIQFSSVQLQFGSEEPEVIVEKFEDSVFRGRSLELQLEEAVKAHEKLVAEKKALESKLAEALANTTLILPENLDYFIERQGNKAKQAEARAHLLQSNAEHAQRRLEDCSLALSNLYMVVSATDTYGLTVPDLQLVYIKTPDGGLMLTESQLLQLTLVLRRSLGLFMEIAEQHRKPFSFLDSL